MSTIINNFNTEENFWQLYPDLLFIGEFKEYYKSDKSRGKKDSSSVMWAIAMLIDKSKNNRFRNLPEGEKKEQLSKHFLENESFDWDSPKNRILIETYEKMILSQAMRSLRNWESKMKERDEFIKNTPYNIDTFEGLDKMLSAYPKMFATYQQISSTLDLDEDVTNESKVKYIKEI